MRAIQLAVCVCGLAAINGRLAFGAPAPNDDDKPQFVDLKFDKPIESVCVSPDNRWLALGFDEEIKLVDVRTMKVHKNIAVDGSVDSSCFAQDGQHLVLGVNKLEEVPSISLMSMKDFSVIRSVRVHKKEFGISAVEVSLDMKLISVNLTSREDVVSEFCVLKLLDYKSLKISNSDWIGNPLLSAFSPDGKYLAVSDLLGSVTIFDRRDYKKSFDLEHPIKGGLWTIRFTEDSRRLLLWNSDDCSVVDVQQKKSRPVIADGNRAFAAVSLWGSDYICGASSDGQITIWSLADLSAIRKVNLPTKDVSKLIGLDKAKKIVVVCSRKKTVRIINAEKLMPAKP